MTNYFDLAQFYTLHHIIQTLTPDAVKKIYRDPVDYDIDKERIAKFTDQGVTK